MRAHGHGGSIVDLSVVRFRQAAVARRPAASTIPAERVRSPPCRRLPSAPAIVIAKEPGRLIREEDADV
jgi:hypothetical protein